uniref:Secreted ookinete protein n=1 Tax=Strongyloides venezuelensis TaxID=75913 RepID=A0A0K0G4L1_STRVS
MFIKCYILIFFLISSTHGRGDKFHLEFSKNEDTVHRYSLDSLEPELASTIFSNLAVNPQIRTTLRPTVKKIKKLVKSSSEINFLVRVKKNTDVISPDYANINGDFFNSDDIMFSHDENSSSEMKQVKSFNKDFSHSSIDTNIRQQVFVDNKSSIIKGDEKNADIETVTIRLPSQDIQLDKEDKNWRKMTKGDFKNSVNHKKNSKVVGEGEEEGNLVGEISDAKNLDDFFNSFDSFSDYPDISSRDKRDIRNMEELSKIIKNKRKIRMGYIKIDIGSNVIVKSDINHVATKPLNNNGNFSENIDDKNEFTNDVGSDQNKTEISKTSKNEANNDNNNEIDLNSNNTTSQKNTILNENSVNETLFENKNVNSTNLNSKVVKTNDFLKKSDALNLKSDILIDNDSLKLDVNKDSSMSTKTNLQKNEIIKTYWNIYYNNGTTRKEMINEKKEIESTTSHSSLDGSIFDNSTLVLNTNSSKNHVNNKNSTSISLPFSGIDNIVTFPSNNLNQDEPMDSNSIYADFEIDKYEKPLKYKNYSMDLTSTTKKEKIVVAIERGVIRKVHNFRSHFIRPF